MPSLPPEPAPPPSPTALADGAWPGVSFGLGAWAAALASRPPGGWLWVPVPALTGLILALWALGWKAPFPFPFLMVGANLLFATLAALVAVWLVSRSFLRRGRPGALLVGCGLLIWAAAGVAISAVPGGDPNRAVTVHSVSVWGASLCHLAGMLMETRWPARNRLGKGWLAFAYLLVLGWVGLVVVAGARGWLGTFFRQGQGGTLARQLVLISAITCLATAALLATRSRSSFRLWYAAALWLIVVGLFGGLLQPAAGSAVGWAGRTAQYLSGIYLMIAALGSVQESGGGPQEDLELEPGLGYLLAILLVLAAVALRLAVLQPLGQQSAFIGFYPAVVVAALFGGLRAGVLATILSAGAGTYCWMGESGISRPGVPGLLALAVFLLGCLMISLSIEALHHARARAAKAEALARTVAIRAEGAAALKRTVGELTRSNRDLEQFAYVASHDLQEPLRMIHAYLGLLQDRYQGRLDPQADTYLGFAMDGATRMQGLIHDLLSYARVGADGEAALAPTDLQACLEQALEQLREAIAAGGARVDWEPLPAVLADAAQVTQVFQNLVGNALKFQGPEPARIHVAATRSAGEVRVSVRDNGIGIDPQAHQKIFDIFQRLHGRGKYPGTGIGLAICKKIVERQGGRIWVASDPGQGATFFFTIPEHPGGLP